jgi:3-oxoacyl-[acyl-carrier protein] reductase
VNTICLGVVKSDQWERRITGDRDRWYEGVARKRQIPLGRVGEAHEFADLVAWRPSGPATGTDINFDGGLSATV